MNEDETLQYDYIEDIKHDVSLFHFPGPTGFPFIHHPYIRKIRKISVVDCETMTNFEFPFVLPQQEGDDERLRKKSLRLPVLILGELVPNKEKLSDLDSASQRKLASSLPLVRIIVSDHFLERTERGESTGGAALTIWVKDHEGVWYRVVNSYHAKYQSMGERLVEKIRQCDLAHGIIPSYRIWECVKASGEKDLPTYTLKAAEMLEVLSNLNTGISEKVPSHDVSYVLEGLMLVDVSKGIFIKSYTNLTSLELLWPKVEQGRSAVLRLPCFLANNLFTLQGPDALYKAEVLKVADALYGSDSAFKMTKRVPDCEDYLTVIDFKICYDCIEDQQCSVQNVGGSSAAVLRGRLKAAAKASNKVYVVAYLQDYYVDIDCTRSGPIGNNPRRPIQPFYFVRPMACAGGCWFKLQQPSSDYHMYLEPEGLIAQFYTWPSAVKDEVWRRISNYEVLEENNEKLIRLTAVNASNYRRVVLKGELLTTPAKSKSHDSLIEKQMSLKVRLYPYVTSIDFGDKGEVDNAGLWMSDLTGAWYKLCQPAAHDYIKIASVDISLAEATLALGNALTNSSTRMKKYVTGCTCGSERKFSIKCSLFKLWEISDYSFDFRVIKAQTALFRLYMNSRICVSESQTFFQSISPSVTAESETSASSSAEELSSDKDDLPGSQVTKNPKRKLPKELSDKGKASSKQKAKLDDMSIETSCDTDGKFHKHSDVLPDSSSRGDGLFAKHEVKLFNHAGTEEVSSPHRDVELSSMSPPPKSSETSDSATELSCGLSDNRPNPSKLVKQKGSKAAIPAKGKRVGKSQAAVLGSSAEHEKIDLVEDVIGSIFQNRNVTNARGGGNEGFKSVREQSGFNAWGLCRQCKAVVKLPTCSNALHKNGMWKETVRLREPAVPARSSAAGATASANMGDNTSKVKSNPQTATSLSSTASSDELLPQKEGCKNIASSTQPIPRLHATNQPVMSKPPSLLRPESTFSKTDCGVDNNTSPRHQTGQGNSAKDCLSPSSKGVSKSAALSSGPPSISIKERPALGSAGGEEGKATSTLHVSATEGTAQADKSRLSKVKSLDDTLSSRQNPISGIGSVLDVPLQSPRDKSKSIQPDKPDKAFRSDRAGGDADRFGRSIKDRDYKSGDSRPTDRYGRDAYGRDFHSGDRNPRDRRRSRSRDREITSSRAVIMEGDRNESSKYSSRWDRTSHWSRSRSRSRSSSLTRHGGSGGGDWRRKDYSEGHAYGAEVDSRTFISRAASSSTFCKFCCGLAKKKECMIRGHVDGEYFSFTRKYD